MKGWLGFLRTQVYEDGFPETKNGSSQAFFDKLRARDAATGSGLPTLLRNMEVMKALVFFEGTRQDWIPIEDIPCAHVTSVSCGYVGRRFLRG
jgi:hypothetical protein